MTHAHAEAVKSIKSAAADNEHKIVCNRDSFAECIEFTTQPEKQGFRWVIIETLFGARHYQK